MVFAPKVGKRSWNVEGIIVIQEDQYTQEELDDREDWHIRNGMRLDFPV